MSEIIVPADGVHEGVPTPDYVAWPLPSSGTPWKVRRRTMKAIRADIDAGPNDDQSVARYLGDVVHCAILESDDFTDRYLPLPDFDPERHTKADGSPATNWRATKAYKEDCARIAEEWPDVQLVERDQWDKAVAMRDQVFGHAEAKALLKADGLVEASIIVTDPEFGIRWKLRPDKIVTKTHANLSVKTTRNAREDVFTHDVFRYGYHVKEAVYRMLLPVAGIDVGHTWILALESEGAHEVALYEMDDAYLDMGREMALKGMAKIAQAMDSGDWPGLPVSLTTLSPPHYAWDRHDEEMQRPYWTDFQVEPEEDAA